jgi:hypothetical protein
MTAKTSGDSGSGVSRDIFQAIQDSFTTQGTQASAGISPACEIPPPRRAETRSDQAR